jgi:hypothetical protein
LRVCFTPQPRPGFALQGLVPREKSHGLVARRCPLVVYARLLPQFSPWLQRRSPAFRAFSRSRVRSRPVSV